jgi:ABC-type Zn uptake system ZnuABC Zn-binding protein ZnuA
MKEKRMKRSILRMQWLSAVVILSLLLSACTAVAPVAPSADNDATRPLKVVATYSVLGDLVRQVAGDRVDLTVLVGADGDPHVYEPTPRDAVALAEAAILFENGLEFETWLDGLFAASGSQATRVAVSDGVDTLAFDAHGHDDDHADHEHAGVAPTRLAVADGKEAVVHLLDGESGDVLATYAVASPARVYAGADGTLAYAVQMDGNQVNVIDTGVRFEPHDDHFHVELVESALLDFALAGTRPIHFVAHDGQIAIFNDGDGTAAIFDEAIVRSGGEVTLIDSGRPHHGVAVPLGDVVLISLPDPNDLEAALPVGVSVRTLDGAEVVAFDNCPRLHGEASIGHDAVAFGCVDGVLIIARDGDGWSSRKIDNPAENPNNARVGTLAYNEHSRLLVGNFSREGVTLFDLEAGSMTPVVLPVPMWAFTWSQHDPHEVLALTIDGSLHTIDGESGELLGSVAVVDAFELPQQGEHGVLRPALIAAGDMAYGSNPAAGEVIEVHLGEMALERQIPAGSAPFALAAFGVMADPHAGEHMHDHDKKTDHSHDHGEAHAHDHGYVHGEFDPHTWMSPLNAIVMVQNIRDALVAADPANADFYAAHAAAYIEKLKQLDAEIRAQLDEIPVEHRKLVTTHELFGYFARDYGFELPGSALGAVTTEAADPGAGQIAALVEEIRSSGVPAIFVENVGNPALMERIAQEAGVTVAPPLYTHGLGPAGSGAEDYLGMMRTNVQIIVEALR